MFVPTTHTSTSTVSTLPPSPMEAILKMKEDLRYDAIRNLSPSSSSTENGSDIEDLDPPRSKPRRRRRKGIWAKAKRYRWIIDSTLLLVIVGLLVERRWSKAHKGETSHGKGKKKGHEYEVLGDITGFADTFSQQITTFTPDHRFAPENPSDFWSNETQSAWLSIVPKGLGYLSIKDPRRYSNLPKKLHDQDLKDLTVYTTSMTHQLHCLYAILDAYNTLTVFGNSANIGGTWHVNHCFEYMRQAIMCAGDVALEGAQTTFPLGPNGEDTGGSDGWDAKHVCKDYNEIFEYLERETIPGAENWIT